MPIAVPQGVDVAVHGRPDHVRGANGTLVREGQPGWRASRTTPALRFRPANEHGLRPDAMSGTDARAGRPTWSARTKGFEYKLTLVGVGFAPRRGQKLNLQIGFAPGGQGHARGRQGRGPDADRNHHQGADRLVRGPGRGRGRAIRPPEPYKGKGHPLRQ